MRLQEFDAKDALAAPDHFAALALVVACHQRKLEGITDIELGIDGDPRAAWRDVEHGALLPGRAIILRQPGRAAVHLPPRFALDFGSSL